MIKHRCLKPQDYGGIKDAICYFDAATLQTYAIVGTVRNQNCILAPNPVPSDIMEWIINDNINRRLLKMPRRAEAG
jgi:hypothetical protein